jgi:hypothetical protein
MAASAKASERAAGIKAASTLVRRPRLLIPAAKAAAPAARATLLLGKPLSRRKPRRRAERLRETAATREHRRKVASLVG